ncbi:hypothetical protein [Pseudomonas lurida]|uniref:hypothetical protein n=1 Tax=Pseudomonas lurida TaxID=244566 RepID=UPI001643FDC1|nr:hypothetical protein [Pseudomonas lurida]MBC3235636.1 hypothetical protein [Pseudomonas lurida]
MIEKLNLACNIKLTEQNEKYRYIQDYIFFRSLMGAVQQNHRMLSLDLKSLQDLNFGTDQSTIFDKRSRVQNSLLNLLNSHKLFVDILKRNHEGKEQKMYARFKVVSSYYYDEDFNYRMFEVLRNYCQHASTAPIDIFSDFEGVTYIFINKQELSKDKKISKKIEKELESPLHIEFNSIVREWISTVLHIYGLVLDYFAYKAMPVIADYLSQLNTDVMALRSDLSVAETMRSVEIKVVKTRMLFPVLPDPKVLCKEIVERLESAEHVDRYSEMKKIFSEIRSSKSSSRRMKRLGAKFEIPKFDTLFIKNLNKYLNGDDLF